MDKVRAELTVNDWNIVMAALSRLPFGDVANLVFDLKRQIEPQVKAADQENVDVG